MTISALPAAYASALSKKLMPASNAVVISSLGGFLADLLSERDPRAERQRADFAGRIFRGGDIP